MSSRGLVPIPAKLGSIRSMQKPSTKVGLQRYLGCINFYHRFLPGIASVLAPLHALVASVARPKSVLDWQDEHLQAFEESKSRLADSVCLAHPDPKAEIMLTTDASDVAVGAVLSQGPRQEPLGFFSKKLSSAEKKYSAFDKELLAVYLAIKHFRPHLDGRHFPVVTDHKPLCGAITSSAERSPRQTRHLSFVSEFTTDIRHLSGSQNVVADALSRPSDADISSGQIVALAAVARSRVHSPAPFNSRLMAVRRLDDTLPKNPVSAPSPCDLARAQLQSKDEMQSYYSESSLKLELLPSSAEPGALPLLCDTSCGQPRPVVPRSLVPAVLRFFHGMSHCGGKATLRLVRSRFVWSRMSSDCLAFARGCSRCQASKIIRHVRSPLVQRPLPDDRFLSLHLDLVGPLPESEGNIYLLTIIDRYSRWLEAVPLAAATAVDCAKALIRSWISRFGTPQDITTDQGPQFTSALWSELMSALGVKTLRTTSYHPQCNGMVERVHRVLKERLMSLSASPSDWMTHLPMVLLGLRSSTRDDSAISPAHLVYGGPLRLPGEFFTASVPPPTATLRTSDFVLQLQSSLRSFTPFSADFHGGQCKTAIPPTLATCPAVFVRVDAVKRPLTPPYTGPYEVIDRSDKTFVLLRAGKPWTVSVDRLKPFFSPVMSAPLTSVSQCMPSLAPSSSVPPAAPSPQPPGSPSPGPLTTRYGRRVRQPDRFVA